MTEQKRDYDDLQMYFGGDYKISDTISIKQPTVGDIINIGEKNYYSIVYALTAISSDLKSILWEMGYDWTEVSDLETFFMMTRELSEKDTSMFFGDLDLTKFRLSKRDDGELIMSDPDTGTIIDRYIYYRISDYLCRLHSVKKKPELPGNKHTKMILIEDDKQRRKTIIEKDFKSQMLPLISSMVNSPGFKYSISDVRDLKMFAFMDSVMRVQTIKSVDYLTAAYYGGNIDTKKFDTNKLNWLCDLQSDK